jgi:hypothetical protein
MIRKVLLVLVVLVAGVALAWAAGFDHRAHLKEYAPDTPCATCHVAGAVSIVPDMAVCLECHAKDDVAGVVLPQPKTHGPVWALNHKAEAKGGAIDCSACHEQSDCLDCHKAGFADEMGSFSNNMINVHSSDFHVTHPLAARTDQRLCASCHEPEYCSSCHEEWRFRTGNIGSPSHRRTFDLGFEDADFDSIHQPLLNSKVEDASLQCDSCHLQSSVAPDFHDWSIGHAREARRSLASCQACHPDGGTCLKCHSARSGAIGVNPPGDDWDDIKGNLKKASNGKTCRKCH